MYLTHYKTAKAKYDVEFFSVGPLKHWGDAFLDNEFAYNCVASNTTASAQKINTEATGIKSLSDIEDSFIVNIFMIISR
jgi:hypothetical protein